MAVAAVGVGVVAAAAAYVSSTMTTSCCCATQLEQVPPVVDSGPAPKPLVDQTILEVVDHNAAAMVAVAETESVVPAVVAVAIECADSDPGIVGSWSTSPGSAPTMPPSLKTPAGRAYPERRPIRGSAAATIRAVGAAELDVPN